MQEPRKSIKRHFWYNTERMEFDKLMAKIEAGDTMMIAKLDRIARSASEGFSDA